MDHQWDEIRRELQLDSEREARAGGQKQREIMGDIEECELV